MRPRLEDQADLHRHHRQPQRVDARRVRRQHGPQHRRVGLVAHRHAAFLDAEALREDLVRQAAGEGVEDVAHPRQDEVVLRHVRRTHVLGQARGGGLNGAEFLRRLRAIAQRQGRGEIKIGRLLAVFDERGDRNLAQDVLGALRFAHVHLDQAAVGLVHRAQSFPGLEVHDRIFLQALVRLTPADNRNFQHEYTYSGCRQARSTNDERMTE